MNKKIPLLAIVGFLGSGKTSLLNHLLKENQGLKIGVIVNDFGAINIDSLLVARQTDSQLELSNGCICCAVDDGGLDDAISQLAHVGSLLDYIVIEASGLAEPHDLALILERSKNKYARLDSIVAVIDVETVLDMSEKHPDFFKQLSIADTLILNKMDLITKNKLNKVTGYLNFLNPNARVLMATHGNVDTRLLLDIETANKNQKNRGDQLSLGSHEKHDHEHLHDSFLKHTFQTPKPLNPQLFEQYINNNLDKNIYRAKGFIYFGMKGLEQKFVFQSVGGRSKLTLDDWQGKVPSTDLVFIGQEFDVKKLQKDLDQLIDKEPDNISGALMDLSLYR